MVIKKADRLFGVRFWAQHYVDRIPKYQVYVYQGHSSDNGLHYFIAYKQPNAMLARPLVQIIGNPWFKPFCLDFNLIDDAVTRGGPYGNLPA